MGRGRQRKPRTGQAWIDQVFVAGQVAKGNIVRRSMHSVTTYASPELLEKSVQDRGFHMALIGNQYVIVCNPAGQIQIVC
jgi:hypothetical protein